MRQPDNLPAQSRPVIKRRAVTRAERRFAVGPGCVAIGTDLDGNYKPVLTSYTQLPELAGLPRDRGLAANSIQQILGGNAAALLRRTTPLATRVSAVAPEAGQAGPTAG